LETIKRNAQVEKGLKSSLGRWNVMDTKLILVEGMPGSGKSTTGKWISERLSEWSIPNHFYHELAENHPLRIYDRQFTSFAITEEAEWFIAKVKQLFDDFVKERIMNDEVVIMESYVFQNTIGFAYNMQMNPEQILELFQSIQQILRPLNPVLIYYYQVNVEEHWRWICAIRGPEFTQDRCGLYSDEDFIEAGKFWIKNQEFVFNIVRNWEISKLIIKNQDRKWKEYEERITDFLKLFH
jgi:thymidylate kinase